MVVDDAVEPRPADRRREGGEEAEESSVELDGALALTVVDLLAHLWSRPTAAELETWDGVAELEEQLRPVFPTGAAPLSQLIEPSSLLEEYERLFVGPGPVLCSPYESFWREDVPADIRRSLMGPCTAELRRLYGELGLELRSESGELPDHLVVELEALAHALSSEGAEVVAGELFFGHLKVWLGRLCRAVLHEAGHPFYVELARTTLFWIRPLERCLAGLLPNRRAEA